MEDAGAIDATLQQLRSDPRYSLRGASDATRAAVASVFRMDPTIVVAASFCAAGVLFVTARLWHNALWQPPAPHVMRRELVASAIVALALAADHFAG